MSGSPAIASLFPLGGSVPPELVIGRTGEIEDISGRLRNGLGTLLSGERRIGKTTVCDSVCAVLRDEGALVLRVDVPERTESSQLLEEIARACANPKAAAAKNVGRVLRPFVERQLTDAGLPVDLARVGSLPTRSVRAIMQLPVAVAERTERPVVLFFDELQRVSSYEDAAAVLTDMLDLYGPASGVTVLADGSDQRTLNGLLGAPHHLAKLLDRAPLSDRIPTQLWREPLTARFEQAGFELEPAALQQIIDFGEGAPFATMAAARYTALAAHKTNSTVVSTFDSQMGVDEAARRLRDDGI